MIKAVIWDVDGTLISTRDLYIESYRRALQPFIGRLLSEEELLQLRLHSELAVLRSQSGDSFEACMVEFRRHYAELHATHFGGVYDGIVDTLQELRSRGIRNGIVTGKSRSSWEITLAEIELGDFDVVIVDDDVANPKPDPEGILAALDHLGVQPRDAIYVGDSPGDMEAALAARTAAAGALWSKNEAWRNRFLQRVRGLDRITLLEQPQHLLDLLGNGR
jgi:phosphoglycolate phosphatase/pyrophosphatase PpaX